MGQFKLKPEAFQTAKTLTLHHPTVLFAEDGSVRALSALTVAAWKSWHRFPSPSRITENIHPDDMGEFMCRSGESSYRVWAACSRTCGNTWHRVHASTESVPGHGYLRVILFIELACGWEGTPVDFVCRVCPLMGDCRCGKMHAAPKRHQP